MSVHRIAAGYAIAALMIGSAANAATLSVTGIVKNVDAKKLELTLQSGAIFQLPKSFAVKTIKNGEKVVVSYDKQADGKLMASEIKKGG